MRTDTQLKDQLLWDQAEASLAAGLEHVTDFGLLLWADKLRTDESELAALAIFAVMYEHHRRSQQ